MKKVSFILLLVISTIFSVQAQSLAKGGRQLNAGFGFSDWGTPIYFGMDFGIQKDITLGFEGSYRSYSETYYGSSTIIGISGNGNYHFNSILEIPNNWDFYGGLNLGFYFWSTPSNYHGDHSSTPGLGLQIGGRYFITDKFGLNLEFGGGSSFSGGKFGITYKL